MNSVIQRVIPSGLTLRVRWLFLLLSLAGLAILTPIAIITSRLSGPAQMVPLILAAYLAWRWVRWYQSDGPIQLEIIPEVLCLTFIAGSMSDPIEARGVIFIGLFYRSLYGSGRQVGISVLAYLVAWVTLIVTLDLESSTNLVNEIIKAVFAFGLMGTAMHVLARTVSAQEQISQQLQSTELEYRTLIEQLPAITYRADKSGTMLYVSPQSASIIGYEPATLLSTMNQLAVDLIHPDDQAAVRERLDESLASGTPFISEHRIITAAGDMIWARQEAKLARSNGHSYWQGFLIDITEQKSLAAQIAHQAFHDLLTKLPNRQNFHDRLESALAYAAQHSTLIAVLFLDLDNFKVVNDNLGHRTGDHLLLAVANRLQANLRDGDTVARLGGDEFTILLENLNNEQDALLLARRIVEQLSAPFAIEGHQLYITPSIGITLNLDPTLTPDDIIRQADIAMYEAKRAGKAGYTLFDHRMERDSWARLELADEMRQAIDSQEFNVYYQPVVDLRTGAIAEVEALVRWEHPTRGLITAANFIELAEETGLIVPVSEWVLSEACRQVRVWQQRFPLYAGLTVSVNLSTKQLRDTRLPEIVANRLGISGLLPENLRLEVTEEAMVTDLEAARDALHALAALGIRIAIDDFGTGNSTLNYLRQLPLDSIKIDRSFISDIEESERDMRFVQTLVTMAKTVGLTVVVEGVETIRQAMLGQIGCDLGQGYYFAGPLTSKAFETLLATDTRFNIAAPNHSYFPLAHRERGNPMISS